MIFLLVPFPIFRGCAVIHHNLPFIISFISIRVRTPGCDVGLVKRWLLLGLEDVRRVLALDIASGIVVAHKDGLAVAVDSVPSAADLRRGFPDVGGEVASGFGEAGVGVVVVLDLVDPTVEAVLGGRVPAASWAWHDGVEVLAIRTTLNKESALTLSRSESRCWNLRCARTCTC